MKPIYRILFFVMCVLPAVAGAAPVATTAGSNLTAYNPNSMGSINNNQWNSMMNSRTGSDSAPTADFGNCNALIMRCAQPKCASGGCTSMDVTLPIVNGCVNSNNACKQYGNDLAQSIAAQIVANSNAKASQAAQDAAAAAAAQSSQQMAQLQQEMNMQMQQMQQQMQMQNQQTVSQLQAALEEQKQIAAAAQQQVAEAQIAQNAAQSSGLTLAQEDAASRGIDSDLIVREQVTGQIMSKLENAETALKTLRDTMKDAFEYAGCDSKGNNCNSPKRVKVFKQKAMGFFEPYNDVLDELYDALITAQAVGVDITDIYMMLNGSCNVWGEYLCTGAVELKKGDESTGLYEWPRYDKSSCPTDGGKSKAYGTVIGGHECFYGGVIPPEDSRNCTLNRTFTTADEQDDLKRDWLEGESADNTIRIGCASSALENSVLFRNRKKQASIDIETLERIIEQDAPQTFGRKYAGKKTTQPDPDGVKYCAVGVGGVERLEQAVALKKLPKGAICIDENDLMKKLENDDYVVAVASQAESVGEYAKVDCEHNDWKGKPRCICQESGGKYYNDGTCACGGDLVESGGKCVPKKNSVSVTLGLGDCIAAGGHYENMQCKCGGIPFNPVMQKCEKTNLGEMVKDKFGK